MLDTNFIVFNIKLYVSSCSVVQSIWIVSHCDGWRVKCVWPYEVKTWLLAMQQQQQLQLQQQQRRPMNVITTWICLFWMTSINMFLLLLFIGHLVKCEPWLYGYNHQQAYSPYVLKYHFSFSIFQWKIRFHKNVNRTHSIGINSCAEN